ncbi:MAG: Gfo/Idh/MocA family protein, partial [Candidatus Thorarchaeota archaeon]
MKKVNLGIIGLGYIGEAHLRNSLHLNEVDVSAVADLSKKALKKAQEMGVKNCYENYSDLLNQKDMDAVVISLPNFLHHKCAIEAFEQGKNVFLEKPMATSVGEAKDIVRAAENRSLKLMIGYPMRFQEKYSRLGEKISSGCLGDIEIVQASYIGGGPFFHRADGHIPSPVPDWWFNKELTGGGVIMDLGCHMINLLRWFFGEVKDIRSYLGYRFNFDF